MSESSPKKDDPPRPTAAELETAGSLSDVEFHQALLIRNVAAIYVFVSRFRKPMMVAVLRAMQRYGVVGKDRADDLLQDVYVDLLKSDFAGIADWRLGGRSLKNYVYTFTWLRTAARLRGKKICEDDIVTMLLTDNGAGLGLVEARSMLAYITEQIEKSFSARDLRICYLSFVEEWSAKEVAAELQISTDLISTTRYRIRQLVLGLMEEHVLGVSNDDGDPK